MTVVEEHVSLEATKQMKAKGFNAPCDAAPTISRATRWLKNYYSIKVEAIPTMFDWAYLLDYNGDVECRGPFRTRDEALNNGIEKALKLI